MRKSTSSSLPAAELISPEFEAFTRGLVATDGVLDVYLHRPAGPVGIAGGPYGPQTIQAQPMAADLASFISTSLADLNARTGLDIRLVDQPQAADVRFYLDSNIDLGDGALVLGIALQNPGSPGHWEVLLNTPELISKPDYLRYASLHELGHTMGLEHPFDDSDGDLYLNTNPYRSAYPDETLMAYRSPRHGGWPVAYTTNDIQALQALWGGPPAGPADRLIGTVLADRLTGGPGDEFFRGLTGADLLRGGRGCNWYDSPPDGAQDSILVSRDRPASLKKAGRTVDVITAIGSEDRLAILGVRTSQISVAAVTVRSPAYGRLEGLGVFAAGSLEALYTGTDLSRRQLSQLTIGLHTDTLA